MITGGCHTLYDLPNPWECVEAGSFSPVGVVSTPCNNNYQAQNTRLEYRSSLLLGAAFSYIDSTSVTLSLSISGCGRERHAGSRIAGWIFDSRVQVQIIPEIERHLERVKMLRNATETSDRRL